MSMRTRRGRARRAALALAGVATLFSLSGCTLIFIPEPDASHEQASPAPSSPTDGDVGEGDASEPSQSYEVGADGVLTPAPEGIAAEAWEEWVRIVTPEYAYAIVGTYYAEDSPDDDIYASVWQSPRGDTWDLSVNLAYAEDPSMLQPTLVHEYGHLLSLANEQLGSRSATCPTLALAEGCAEPGSDIFVFDALFWSDYSDAPAPDNADADVAYDFYLSHEDDFVDDYAATNVVEDFAESFMIFVLEDHRPSDDSISSQKIGFFWADQDYVAIRDRIRTAIGK